MNDKSTRQAAYEEMLMIRGIKEPCKACSGLGVTAYGNTSTWHHGIGGQAVTSDICDECWGSGDKNKPWMNLKHAAKLTQDIKDRDEAISRAIKEMRHSAEHDFMGDEFHDVIKELEALNQPENKQ
jgi:hypothetical protein